MVGVLGLVTAASAWSDDRGEAIIFGLVSAALVVVGIVVFRGATPEKKGP
jgi:hypothetical protein